MNKNKLKKQINKYVITSEQDESRNNDRVDLGKWNLYLRAEYLSKTFWIFFEWKTIETVSIKFVKIKSVNLPRNTFY